jgi:hypothetical protein
VKGIYAIARHFIPYDLHMPICHKRRTDTESDAAVDTDADSNTHYHNRRMGCVKNQLQIPVSLVLGE